MQRSANHNRIAPAPATQPFALEKRAHKLAAYLAGCLLLLCTLGGCASGPDPVDAFLFFDYEPGTETNWNVSPALLSAWKTLPKADEDRGFILWPLLHYVREGRELELSFLGIPYYQKNIDQDGFEDLDIIAGPVLYGESKDEGVYFSLLPLGGWLHEKLGKEFAILVLPPIYIYAEGREFAGKSISHHVLWPFFNTISGGGKEGFRIWPFFGHYTRTDREGNLAYDRTWIMWPFWTDTHNNLNSGGEPQHTWFLWPFFGRSTGRHTSGWTALWPLFKYFENRKGGSQYWELRAPFPLLIIGEGNNRSRFDLWPFYGQKERRVKLNTAAGGFDHFYRHFVLWPLWRYEHHVTDTFDDTKWWILPLLWHFERTDPEGNEVANTWKLWPLFRYKKRGGTTTVNFISPLWFPDAEGAFEEIYNRLTALYQHKQSVGKDELKLLWGLFTRRETMTTKSTKVFPWLYWDTEDEAEEERSTGVLFGLFQYKRRGKDRALRFLWLPEWPSWTESP